MALLVDEVIEDEECQGAWSSEDRKMFDQIRIKLSPEVRDEILDLEKSFAQSSMEGEKSDGE